MSKQSERAQATRSIQNLFVWYASSPSRPTWEALLEGIPSEYHELLKEEAESIRTNYQIGDHGSAFNRAHAAAALLIQAYGPGSDSPNINPREMAAHILDGEPLLGGEFEQRTSRLKGGSDPDAPVEVNDPRALAKQIADKGGN